jgi:hypothetical protein
MNTFELNYLTERLEELENAANHLTFIIENEDGGYYQSELIKSH